MRRNDGVFTQGERRLAALAVVVVAGLTVLALTAASSTPSLGGRSGAGFADLPGVMDATPLR